MKKQENKQSPKFVSVFWALLDPRFWPWQMYDEIEQCYGEILKGDFLEILKMEIVKMEILKGTKKTPNLFAVFWALLDPVLGYIAASDPEPGRRRGRFL